MTGSATRRPCVVGGDEGRNENAKKRAKAGPKQRYRTF